MNRADPSLRSKKNQPGAPAFAPTDGAERPKDPPLNPEANSAHADLLKDIQGNILKSQGREFVRLVLFRFDGTRDDAALRALLCDAVSDDNADATGARWKITTAYQQWDDARSRDLHRPFYGLGLSYAGLKRCGYTDGDLPLRDDTQSPPKSTGFGASMNDPAIAKVLGDRVSAAEPRLPDWEKVYRDGVDGVWLLAHCDPSQLDAMERRVTDFLSAHLATKTGVEHGFRWNDDRGNAREPFGFRDGISEPVFFYHDCYRADPDDPESPPWVQKWVNLPRSQALMAAGPHAGGSFLVLRKLEQNVQAFRDTERAIQATFTRPAPGAVLPRHAGALLMGRERDGTPLADLTGPADQNIDREGPNRFDFNTDESRCPFHAHIRKAAPRMAPLLDLSAPPPPPAADRDVPVALNALFVRRSVIYDSYGQLPPSGTLTDDPAADPAVRAHSYASRSGGDITREVGLLFMGYMSNIVSQFQKLQSDWFGSLDFPFAATDVGDPVVRHDATLGEAKIPAWSWSKLPHASVPLPQTVTPRGGAYFYVPSISWLRQQRPAATPAGERGIPETPKPR